ncbi:helix-turn-helix domain-containing protein [Schaalia cardiffensis]|nr:helix-turn-helix transcriptional regulator [Schaalia cardiffensis]
MRGIREIRGMTVDQLANGMGISRAYLSNIEDGRKRPTALATEALVVPQVALVRDEYFDREQAELEGERRKAEAHLKALRTEAQSPAEQVERARVDLDALTSQFKKAVASYVSR